MLSALFVLGLRSSPGIETGRGWRAKTRALASQPINTHWAKKSRVEQFLDGLQRDSVYGLAFSANSHRRTRSRVPDVKCHTGGRDRDPNLSSNDGGGQWSVSTGSWGETPPAHEGTGHSVQHSVSASTLVTVAAEFAGLPHETASRVNRGQEPLSSSAAGNAGMRSSLSIRTGDCQTSLIHTESMRRFHLFLFCATLLHPYGASHLAPR